jgi:hypothetical protein
MNSNSEQFSDVLDRRRRRHRLEPRPRTAQKGVRRITILERGAEVGANLRTPPPECSRRKPKPTAPTRSPHSARKVCGFIRFRRRTARRNRLDIELDRSGTLYLAFTENDSAEIRRRYEWQKSAGLPLEHLTAQETRAPNRSFRPTCAKVFFSRRLAGGKSQIVARAGKIRRDKRNKNSSECGKLRVF